MQIILAFNVIVLSGLTLFFFREERRFRKLSKRIAETKEDLTSIVHQLRSPLSNLRKYNEFLQSNEFGTLTFSQQEAISRVQSSLVESLSLLNRLLARSRLDDARIAVEPSSVQLREIVDGAVDAVRPAAERRKHILSIIGQTKVRVITDPLLLHGILDEILSNAVQYTPEGGTVRVTIVDRDSFMDIEVRDTGIGISDTERPHIFEKFYRGERAKPMFAGNGLGLAFAQQFSQTLGGTVRFTSKEGKGSVFTLSLPKQASR